MGFVIRLDPDPSTYYLGGLGQIIISLIFHFFN